MNTEHQLCLDELRGPDGWNWTATPSVFPLLDRVTVAGTQITPLWKLAMRNASNWTTRRP